MLHYCIDEAQSAFILECLITDNIMVAYEILHYMKKRRMGKNRSFAFKLDMNKAYDRVEWGFIEAMLSKMSFSSLWVDRIMRFVTTISYSIIVNGTIGERFFPSRGLRQGNPLSSYLILIYGEGLSTLLRVAKRNGKVMGARLVHGALKVSHLLFMDDSLIFEDVTS